MNQQKYHFINEEKNLKMKNLCEESSKGNLDAVKLLIQNGAEINDTDDEGSTALVTASSNGHLEVV